MIFINLEIIGKENLYLFFLFKSNKKHTKKLREREREREREPFLSENYAKNGGHIINLFD